MDITVIPNNLWFMLGGLVLTFELAFLAISGGLVLGIVLAMARISKKPFFYHTSSVYVNLFRGIPLILIIFWFYFLLPVFTGRSLGEFASVVVAFIVYEAAYFSEIVRAGIQSVPRGQSWAARASGMTPFQVARFVVLRQAIKNMTPALVTHAIVIFQDTSLAYVIGLREFLRRVNLVDAREARSVELYLFAAGVYFILCSLGTACAFQLTTQRNPTGAAR